MSAIGSQAMLRASGLPTYQQLQQAYSLGLRHLVNVSGINLHELYQQSTLPDFMISHAEFADIFTSQAKASQLNHISSDAYVQVSGEQERQALFSAVHALFMLISQQIPVWVFCHRGLGRSPLVVASALQQFYGEDCKQAIARTYAIQPSAHFSTISIAALQWCQEQW